MLISRKNKPRQSRTKLLRYIDLFHSAHDNGNRSMVPLPPHPPVINVGLVLVSRTTRPRYKIVSWKGGGEGEFSLLWHACKLKTIYVKINRVCPGL